MRCTVLGLSILITAAGFTVANAQVEEPTKVVNERFSFAFTVEANTLVIYPENGDGFEAIHNPAGGGKGTQPDYGLHVFGGYLYRFSEEQAEAAKLTPPEETILAVEDIGNNTRFAELMKGAMSAYDRESAADAVVGVVGGSSIKVPYFTWSKTIQGKTHYALLYAVIHGDAFITVQVESSRPLTKQQTSWFTTKLELLELPEPDEPPATGA